MAARRRLANTPAEARARLRAVAGPPPDGHHVETIAVAGGVVARYVRDEPEPVDDGNWGDGCTGLRFSPCHAHLNLP